MTAASAFAPAKINLFLHVGATADDGYHPLTSWMMFADVGDTLSLKPSQALGFEVSGPFGAGLPTGAGNLVVRARDAMIEASRRPADPFTLTLDKSLPVASGMGGGSSDAAAALRLVGKALGVTADGQIAAARELGADVPACLYAQSVMARGRGDLLSTSPKAPPLPAVLVNPGVAVSTAQIFKAFDQGPPGDLRDVDPPRQFPTVTSVINFLQAQRNDLQPHATALQPVIAEVSVALAQEPEARLVRMTGSGATVFALCESYADACRLADVIANRAPQWWVTACTLA